MWLTNLKDVAFGVEGQGTGVIMLAGVMESCEHDPGDESWNRDAGLLWHLSGATLKSQRQGWLDSNNPMRFGWSQ